MSENTGKKFVGVCARAGCSNEVEPDFISGGGSRPAALQAVFERMAKRSIYCATCTLDAEAYEREKEMEQYVRARAMLGIIPGDLRMRRLELSNRAFEKQNAEAWRRARAQWPIDVLQRSLAFEGPPGVGKTWAACCLINAQLDKGRRVASISTSDALDGRDLKLFKAVDWLHLDDFDKVEWTKKKCLSLFHLFEGIYQHSGRVVLCLNGTLEDVFEKQKRVYRGQWQTVRATFDRLHPCCREPMAGENLRKVVNA